MRTVFSVPAEFNPSAAGLLTGCLHWRIGVEQILTLEQLEELERKMLAQAANAGE